MQLKRGDVVLIYLDPTVGREIKKTRPCVIVSPDELNEYMATYIVAPMTTGSHTYPFRIPCTFKGKDGHIIIDQIRTIDEERIVRVIGKIPEQTLEKVLNALQEMFTK